MNCIACDAKNEMRDGKFILASFLTASGRGPHYICKSCATLATIAWAVKHRADTQPPPPSPSPTNPPAGAGEVETRAREARTFNARAA
jgi:hypothetical protein